MTGFQARVFSGAIDPEDLEIVRRVVVPTGQAGVLDTAYYGDVRAELPHHRQSVTARGAWRTSTRTSPVFTGVDTVRGIERLQFTDGTFNLTNISNLAAYGTINLSPLDPEQGEQIAATPAFNDPQGVNAGSIVYTWQSALPVIDGADEDGGDWAAIATAADATTFTPTEAETGRRIRVVATFQDSSGATRVDRLAGHAARGQRQRRADGSRHRQHGAARRRRPDRQRAGRPRWHHDGGVPPPVAGRGRRDVHEHPRRDRSDVHRQRCPGRPAVRVVVTYTDDRGRRRWPCRRRPPQWSARHRRRPPAADRRWRRDEFVGCTCRRRSGRSTLAPRAGVVPTGSMTTVNVVTAGVPADATAVSLNVTATGTYRCRLS